MAPSRSEFIERSAADVLRRANVTSAPVDLNKVAEALGAKVSEETWEDKVSGVLLVKGDVKHIMLNSSHTLNRKRFSFAHELGHLVLHASKAEDRLFVDTQIRVYRRVGAPSDVDYQEPGSMTTPDEEREANLFAATLLMPAALLEHAAFRRNLFDEWDVTALAEAFGVSEQAMFIRLQSLRLLDPISSSSDALSDEPMPAVRA